MTDMHKSDGRILKTDTKGRVRTPADRRESLLDEFERSGLSAAKFSELAGIKYQTFAAWSLRRRKRAVVSAPVKPPDSVRWLEAVVEQAQTSDRKGSVGLRVMLPGGATVEIGEVKQVALAAALLRAWEKSC
jgi:hypothetical protein